MDYQEFLETKRMTIPDAGFEAQDINPQLFPFQRDIVRWNCRRGKSAVFADCGLGKTPIQLEFARQIYDYTGENVLIVAPLAVSAQTKREGEKFGVEVNVCKTDLDRAPGINITNYERLHYFSPDDFGGIVLDESSILKAFSGKVRQQITEFASTIPYRLCCTATPAPNDFIELLNHAEFLDILSGKEIIALFFTQDGNTTHKWRIKGHAQEEFWSWMSEWAVALRAPSDLGYEDDGFILPLLDIHHVEVEGQALPGMLFPVKALTLDEQRQARKVSLPQRVETAAKLINDSSDAWIVWCNLNAESSALIKAIDGAVEIRGSDKPEDKESRMLAFSDGKIRVLVTKPSIAGFGMNWQHCNKAAFVGLSHSYEQFYQATRRIWRFGQKRPVDVYVITSENEGRVVANIQRKERQAAEMFDQIVKRMSITSGVKAHQGGRRIEMEYETKKESSGKWTMYLGDAIEVIDTIPNESIGLTITSPPFPGMYVYTNSPRDVGNVSGLDEMIEHFRYLVGPDKLMRITQPGRSIAIHLTQLTAMKSREGYMGLHDYRGEVIRMMTDLGWHWTGEACVSVNPQMQAIRNKEHQLLFKSLAKDSAIMRPALPDWLLKFTKPGDNQVPIRAGLSDRYKNEDGWITEEDWILWADGIWWADDLIIEQLGEFDIGGLVNYLTWGYYKKPASNGIDRSDQPCYSKDEIPVNIGGQPVRSRDINGVRRTDVLNVKQARETDDERHLCPLQLGVIERAMKLWSAPGETVFDPFAGVGSTGYKALMMNRKFIGIELKRSYYESAVHNLKDAEKIGVPMDLFTWMATQNED